jgi:hypothetical protein
MNMLPPLNGQVSGLTENFLYYKPVARYWLPVSFDQPASVLSDGSPLASPNVNSIRIDTPENCRIAISVMAGALGYFWWSTNGDDLNVPPWIIKTFPIPVFTAEERREVLMLSDELETRLSSEIFWTKNAGQWVSNYDLAACRAITDRIDEVYLDAIGMRDCQSALKAWYWTVMKSTGDPTGSLRGPVPPPQRR